MESCDGVHPPIEQRRDPRYFRSGSGGIRRGLSQRYPSSSVPLCRYSAVAVDGLFRGQLRGRWASVSTLIRRRAGHSPSGSLRHPYDAPHQSGPNANLRAVQLLLDSVADLSSVAACKRVRLKGDNSPQGARDASVQHFDVGRNSGAYPVEGLVDVQSKGLRCLVHGLVKR